MSLNKTFIYKKYVAGFSLVELLVAMGLLGILLTVSSVNLVKTYRSPTQSGAIDVLLADIKAQQMKAMQEGLSYGVFIGTNSYTLFKGSTYNSSDTSNFVVNLDSGYAFINSETLVFAPITGELTPVSITLSDTQLNNNQTLKFNKYGVTY